MCCNCLIHSITPEYPRSDSYALKALQHECTQACMPAMLAYRAMRYRNCMLAMLAYRAMRYRNCMLAMLAYRAMRCFVAHCLVVHLATATRMRRTTWRAGGNKKREAFLLLSFYCIDNFPIVIFPSRIFPSRTFSPESFPPRILPSESFP